jgi:hypothetical protein
MCLTGYDLHRARAKPGRARGKDLLKAVGLLEKDLSFGIFWVITDNESLEDYKLLGFRVPCDTYGNPKEPPEIPLNSKSGTSYNHQMMWNTHIRNNPQHKPYNKKDFNHFPRGRVEVSKNKAVIYLNPNIIQDQILEDIQAEFGLSNMPKARVVADNSAHYACFIN